MTTVIFNQWLGAGLILLMFSASLSTLSLYQRRFQPDAETVRKIFHIAMGLCALAFPFLIRDVWLGFVIAGTAILLLLAIRKFAVLQKRFGTVCGSVQRRSYGEIYFAAGIAILFSLAHNNFLLYAISLLVLTFADAAAALVGVSWGKHFYRSIGGQKSWEGSFSFFVVATACIYAPLRFAADLQSAAIFLIALTISLLLTIIEALSWRGLDNIFLPLGSHLLLTDFLHRNSLELLALLLAVTLWGVTFFIFRKREQQYVSHH